jgi:preprotein translocase subunit SecG
MIFIFGFSLIYWTGLLTGLFFVLSFLGCRCHVNSRICKIKLVNIIKENHKLFIYLAFIFFIVHLTLAILARYGAGI